MALLEMRGITKAFPGVVANSNVSLCVEEGEIHALLGENGAGKTTLMNILYGLYQADAGEILWEGQLTRFLSPAQAIAGGIGMVHQHFMLVEKMTVMQNIILGLRPKGYPFIKSAHIARELAELSNKFGLWVDVDKRVSTLSVGQQQRIEILKALYRKAKLLILDEPTAVLAPQEVVDFFGILRALRQDGHSVILISHRLEEIMAVCDRVTVLRNGTNVTTLPVKDTDIRALSRWMIGRELEQTAFADRTASQKECVLEIHGATVRKGSEKPALDAVNLQVRRGEILGIAGVDGNGQKELAEAICGITKLTAGSISFRGSSLNRYSIRKRFTKGISYVPGDRHKDGLILNATVRDNLILRRYHMAPYARGGIMEGKRIEKKTMSQTEAFDIKTPSVSARVANLSGGNQQKIILAREMDGEPELLVAMQPTRGLDIGASLYVHRLLMEYRNKGKSVLLISTDLDELMSLSDRVAVFYSGRNMGVLEAGPALQPETIGLLMGGETLEEVAP